MIAPSPLLLLLTGAGSGLVGSLLGLGGGVFLVPILALGLGVPIRAAIAASLISVIATASASAVVNLSRGMVNLRLGLVLEIATSLGGLAGGMTSALLTQRQLFVLFGMTLGMMGVLMAVRSKLRNVIADRNTDPGLLGGRLEEGGITYVYQMKNLPFGLFISLVAGALSGLLGVGGGVIKVPALNTFCGIPIKVAAATSTFMIGVTAAASAFIYFNRGDVSLPLTAAVALGAFPGSAFGARLSRHIEARYLKLFMAIVLILVGVQMAFEAL